MMAVGRVENLIAGSSLTEEAGLIVELRRTVRVNGIALSIDPAVLMNDVLTASGLPSVGHTITIGSQAVVLEDRDVQLRADREADVNLVYRRQEIDTPTYRGGTTLEQITTELDAEGDQIVVEGPNEIEQGGEISVGQPQATLIADVVTATNAPGTLSSQWAGFVNEDTWNGGAPVQWLCEDVSFEPVDMGASPKKWRFQFVFRRKRRDSEDAEPAHQPQVIYIDPETNRPPPDLVPDVGFKTVTWYPSRNFGATFAG
jgi:hypothetical protein